MWVRLPPKALTNTMPYKDREKQLQAQRDAYHAKKSYYRARRKLRHGILKEWFHSEIIPTMKCSRCPEVDIACLDFHHVDPTQKESPIMAMIKALKSKEKIISEMQKCIVLCSNCHRKHHYYEEKS